MNITERLRLKIKQLTAANDRQAETITRQSRANSELHRINALLTRKLDVAKRDIAELQRAPGPNIGE